MRKSLNFCTLLITESVSIGDPIQPNSHPAGVNSAATREKKPTESRANEEEDDDDFINLKADVEAGKQFKMAFF